MQTNESQGPQTDVPCLIGLGANLGNRALTLTSAIDMIAKLPVTSHVSPSGFYETAPIGGPAGQPPFLNAAVSFCTKLSPDDLVSELRKIERMLGRERHERWSARTIDLDVLLFGDQTIVTEHLIVPHDRFPFRRFVLEPAAEIAAEWVHPTTGLSISELASRLDRRPTIISVDSELDDLRPKIDAALAEEISLGSVVLAEADENCPTFRLSSAARRTTEAGVPHLYVPADDPPLAITEITAAIAAINDPPRRLPASYDAKQPGDKRSPPDEPC